MSWLRRRRETKGPLDTQDEASRAAEIQRVAEEHPERTHDMTTARTRSEAASQESARKGRPGEGQGRVPVPPPLSQDEMDLEARIRVKNEMGEPLTEEERAFYTRTQGDKEWHYRDQ